MIIEEKILKYVGIYESHTGKLDVSWNRSVGFMVNWGQQRARMNLRQIQNVLVLGGWKKIKEGEMRDEPLDY